MSDEIDIEEHDVLDNPSIKRIFPDLTVIKKEINQYYDEAFNALPDTTLEEPIQEVETTMDSKALLTKNSHVDDNESSFNNAPKVTESPKESRYLPDNIIILGSKPSLGSQKNKYNCKSIKKQEPRLILKNVSTFLNRCKRYCKTCLILFPKANVLNLHMFKVHRSENNDGTTKTKHFMKRKLSGKLYKCHTCHMTLSSRSNLIRHFRNLHGKHKTNNILSVAGKHKTNNVLSVAEKHKKNNVLSVADKTVSLDNKSKMEESTGLACFHCKLLFPNQSSLIEHLYQVLDPVTGANNSMSSKETKKIDNDQATKEECVKKIYKPQNIECSKCTLEFRSQDKYEKHVKDSHREIKQDTNNCNSAHNFISNKNKRKFPKRVVGLPECHNENNKNFVGNNIKEKYTRNRLKNKCKACSQYFRSQQELKCHIRSTHRTKARFNNENQIPKVKKEALKIPKSYYKCFVCSKYNTAFTFYSRHLVNDHNIKEELTKVKKVPFTSKCEFCSSKMSTFKSYNLHIYRYHKTKVRHTIFSIEEQTDNKDMREESRFALKSTLFQCMTCEVYFLSSNTAMDHLKHSEMLNNWECSICQRIFKIEDKELHVKQHMFSLTFSVHTLSETEFRRVLYKCSSCTVHYSEERFMVHYKKCDTETPNSVYCRICDVLINKDDMDFHEVIHEDRQITCFDFTIIESDIVNIKRLQTNKIDVKKYSSLRRNKTQETIQGNSKLEMNYCHTCKCFISNSHTRNVHIEARCGHMLKVICKECGLLLTSKTHATHKEVHKTKQLKLHDYLFFDLTTKKQICPPIPDYPKCNVCGVHFLRHSAITIHSCKDQDYITCDICTIKLTEHAYKLHMAFHSYSIKNIDAELKHTDSELRPANDMPCMDSNLSLDNISTADYQSVLFYTCKGCQITVDTYDKVVQHCQDHYDCKKVQLDIERCQNCNLVFVKSDYESHHRLHLKDKYSNHSITVDFDPFYFCYNNGFWTKHIFAYVADEQIGKILDTSIYKSECRLKLEEIQPGSSGLILYKCEKCLSFIDPHSLYMHVKNGSDKSCVQIRKFPCAFCGLCFGSINYRTFHEKEHKCIDTNFKSYKIISFNKLEHETFNIRMFEACNKFILYQCRTCDQVTDKFQRKDHKCDVNNLTTCITCGLFLHRQDYDLHFIRHEELEKFKTENITVVMFGKKCHKKKELRPTFSGTKYDYTIYKCNNCDLCLRTKKYISKHACVFNDSKHKCSKCGLYFLKCELKYHSGLHESNLEFDELNMEIISFDGSSVSLDVPKEPGKDTEVLKESIGEVNGKSSDKETTKDCLTKLERIYKCDCGLHFLEECNALQHSNNCNIRMKISKQSCFKCDLLFTPGELFNHLLKHHCDKKLQYKFDIVFVSKNENIQQTLTT